MDPSEPPDDPRLPALAAFREHGLAPVLAPHGVRLRHPGVRVLARHPGARCVLLVEAARGPVVVKAYAEDPAPVVAVLDALAALDLADGRAPTVPPLLAWDRTFAFTVTQLLAGPSARELIADAAPERAAALAVAWLRAAARVPLPIGSHHTPEQLLEDARFPVSAADGVDDALAAQAAFRLAALAADPPGAGRPALVHGSFTPRHLIELPGGPGIVDTDALGHGALEVDAGMMLASLSRIAGGHREHVAAARRAAQLFRDGIADLADDRALEWYRAAHLVRLARRIVKRRPMRWAEQARALLDDAGGAVPAGR